MKFSTLRFGLATLIVIFFVSCEPESEESDQIETPEAIIEIPDEFFKNVLVNTQSIDTNTDEQGDSDIDLNNDGEIQISEALKIEGLIIPIDYSETMRQIDFSGINNFINLKYLNITGRNSGSLPQNTDSLQISYDFSGLIQLKKLKINGLNAAYFKAINLSGLSNLKEANLDGNKPKYFGGNYDIPFNFIDVSMTGCTSLENLTLVNSWLNIDFCDVPAVKHLNMFYLEGGEPSLLDLHCLSELEWLDISENVIDSLILKNNSVLTYFRADDIGSAYEFGNNYPFVEYLCIDDIPQEFDQVSTLINENTVVTTECSF